MKRIHNLFAGLALSFACICTSHAAQQPGAGAGYYGTAEYSDGGGSTVGPYATWIECSDALEAAVENAANNAANFPNWSVVSVSGCGYYHHYIADVAEAEAQLVQLDIVTHSPWESVRKVHDLLGRVRAARARYAADEYEAALIAISRASAFE